MVFPRKVLNQQGEDVSRLQVAGHEILGWWILPRRDDFDSITAESVLCVGRARSFCCHLSHRISHSNDCIKSERERGTEGVHSKRHNQILADVMLGWCLGTDLVGGTNAWVKDCDMAAALILHFCL